MTNDFPNAMPAQIAADMAEIDERNIPGVDGLRDVCFLISGAYGMLASYLVWFLIYLNEKEASRNIKIIALGRSEEKLLARFGDFAKKPYFTFWKADVTEAVDYDGPVDYIVHAASHAQAKAYGENPVGVMLPNLLGTYQLLSLARKKQVKSFLFFSSGEVYGKAEQAVVGEHDFGAYDPTLLRSCYGESKRAGETLCVSFAAQYGVPAKIVRPSHTYGPTMDVESDGRVFAAFVGNALRGEDIVMQSDGSDSRVFCYLADATAAYLTVLLQGANGEAYNVTNRNGKCTIGALAEMIAAMAPDGAVKVVRGKTNESVPSRGDRVYDMLDTSKVEALGWESKVSVEEGFRRTIRALCLFEK